MFRREFLTTSVATLLPTIPKPPEGLSHHKMMELILNSDSAKGEGIHSFAVIYWEHLELGNTKPKIEQLKLSIPEFEYGNKWVPDASFVNRAVSFDLEDPLLQSITLNWGMITDRTILHFYRQNERWIQVFFYPPNSKMPASHHAFCR